MKITLELTDETRLINGMSMRIGEGETEKGIKCFALIPVIAAHKADDNSEFERDLLEHRPSSAAARACFDLRFIL